MQRDVIKALKHTNPKAYGKVRRLIRSQPTNQGFITDATRAMVRQLLRRLGIAS